MPSHKTLHLLNILIQRAQSFSDAKKALNAEIFNPIEPFIFPWFIVDLINYCNIFFSNLLLASNGLAVWLQGTLVAFLTPTGKGIASILEKAGETR